MPIWLILTYVWGLAEDSLSCDFYGNRPSRLEKDVMSGRFLVGLPGGAGRGRCRLVTPAPVGRSGSYLVGSLFDVRPWCSAILSGIGRAVFIL